MQYRNLDAAIKQGLSTLTADVQAIFSRAMKGAPGLLIASDFPRLARSFAVFRVDTQAGATDATATATATTQSKQPTLTRKTSKMEFASLYGEVAEKAARQHEAALANASAEQEKKAVLAKQ